MSVTAIGHAFCGAYSYSETGVGTRAFAYANSVDGDSVAVGKRNGAFNKGCEHFGVGRSVLVHFIVDADSVLREGYGANGSGRFNVEYAGHACKKIECVD